MKVGEKRIVVIEAGNVIMGVVTEITDTHYHMDYAQVVRRWGTERGLAQLAVEGPSVNTVLEQAAMTSIRRDKELFSLLCVK